MREVVGRRVVGGISVCVCVFFFFFFSPFACAIFVFGWVLDFSFLSLPPCTIVFLSHYLA